MRGGGSGPKRGQKRRPTDPGGRLTGEQCVTNSIEAFRIEFGEDGKGSLIFVGSEYGPQAGVSRTSMTSVVSFPPSSLPLILFVHFLGQMVEDGGKDGSGNCFAGGEGGKES